MRSVIASAFAAITFATAPALAEETYTLEFTLERPSTMLAAAAEHQRLQDEAWDVCRTSGQRLTLQQRRERRLCTNDLVNQVVAAVDNPYLTAMHENRGERRRYLAQLRRQNNA